MVQDYELVEGLVKRDTKALEVVIETFSPAVYALCARILNGVGGSVDFEECTSDVFYAAWTKIGQYDAAKAPLRTWLLILAKYISLERRRTLSRRQDVYPMEEKEAGDIDDSFARFEQRQQIQAALATLSPLDRELVYKFYFLDYSVEELAKSYDLTRQAVDNRLWRARKSLRLAMSGLREVAHSE